MNQLHLPASIDEVDPRRWDSFSDYFAALEKRPLTEQTLLPWLADWSQLASLFEESLSMLYIEKSIDTTDESKEQAFLDMLNNVLPPATIADQKLKERLLQSGAEKLPDMEIVLRNLGNEVALFREENIPLQTELEKLSNTYDKITGGMQVDWHGEPKNLSQLTLFLQDKKRPIRQKAWQAMMRLWQTRRSELNQLYKEMLVLRQQVAANAGFSDYRDYAFRERGRFDYTPEDCFVFHDAIERVVVPAAQRIYDRRKERLAVVALRPWDVHVDPSDAPQLTPYNGQDELINKTLNMLQQVDPQLAHYFAVMAEEQMLDLDTRPGKALGGYCSRLALRKRPFIFMNGVGIHDNVQTLLHEAGHAFHDFETNHLPYIWQTEAPMEFCEVASMAMELLAAPYLSSALGGFYTDEEAARARIEHLESIITFLPYMAVVDSFQHWVYTHLAVALDSSACDQAWEQLWQRFMKGVDWSGFEPEMMSGWHRKLHIFTTPFYYIEYGMAQVGALQIWANSLQDQTLAMTKYRQALALGGTKSLPQLFATAGVAFRFDQPMLQELVTLIEVTVDNLQTIV